MRGFSKGDSAAACSAPQAQAGVEVIAGGARRVERLTFGDSADEGLPVTNDEWAVCDEPLLMLDAVRDTAQPQTLRRFAVICCEPLLAVLDQDGRWAINTANRLAHGEATEAERAQAEQSAFRFADYNDDLDRYYYNEDYEAAGYPPYQTDPQFAAAEAAAGAVAADPWLGARVAARSALEVAGNEGRAAEKARLCAALRSLMK
jgi:hypothetical protein